MPKISRRSWLRLAMIQAGLGGVLGCGTVLHPERRGQAAGPLDWKIVLLDGIGLLFFFVPGVIAFAVDFSNGTIYLPEGSYGQDDQSRKKPLVTRQVPRKSLTVPALEQVLAEHTGKSIRLKSGTYQTESLSEIDQFWPMADQISGV